MRGGIRVLLGVASLVAAIAAVGWPLYVTPASDEPRAVDAVYVIGPPTDFRMAVAEQMVADGLTGTVVVSLTDDDGRQAWERASELCDGAVEIDFSLECRMPDPFTTRGEARWLRELVDQHGWESVAVVTFTPHLTRTRVIMERCWSGDIVYVDSREPITLGYWAYQYAYQSAAFVKVALEDGC
ncbi:YdcF family protein [Demequina subtropica]|uniref:YdcF family protein n=1 Tax=Demequina subtropica TaxID=1638989 RepID=UPI000ABBBC64|nr:YdcF family protein [Demequina subtropica]